MKSHTAVSVNKVIIRLTDERWQHILIGHPELNEHISDVLNAINQPDQILAGERDEFKAVIDFDSQRKLIVIYSEVDKNDGFVITAYLTSKIRKLNKMKQIWP